MALKIKTISIIGGTGKIGSVFASAFKEKGYDVIVSSRKSEIKPIDATARGDLVIVSVPIGVTEEVIKEIGNYVRKDSVLMDFTSVKTGPCKMMKKFSKSKIIGGHPLFGPGVAIKGESIVLCKVRGETSELKRLFEEIGLKVIEMSAEEHDKEMAIIQCANQFSNIGFGSYLVKERFDLGNKLLTPAMKLKLSVVGRTLSQNPELYPEILLHNPYAKKAINQYIKSLKELNEVVKKGDEKELVSKIEELKKYFGDSSEKARELTNKILNEDI
jgi:prephenate dehydrogenase